MTDSTQHIAADRMVELAQGRLPAADHAETETHINTCVQCRTQYTRVERVVAITRTDTTEDVPTHVLARAQRLMRQSKVEQPTLRQRIVAAIRFDSRLASAAPGMRAQASSTRQLLFNAGPHDIDVRIKPSGSRWTVAGQVLGTVTTGSAELEGTTNVRTTLNELGEWTFPPVTEGSYTLRLTLDALEVAVRLLVGS